MLDFLGIGAQKCGTTWLYEMLRLHPAVRFPAGKEVHYWDGQRGIEPAQYQSWFGAGQAGVVQGEITPAYAILPVPDIRRVRDFSPALRVLYSIRNPVDRAWSAALRALERAEMTPDEASDQWFLDHIRSAGSRMRGDYAACLHNWCGVFSPDSILVLRYERITIDPRGLLADCARHLGIDARFYEQVPGETLARRHYAGRPYPMRPALRDALRDLYREPVARLAARLKTDLHDWLE